MFEDFAARTVTTLHGRLDLKDLAEVYSRWHDYPLVSISDDQRKPLANANWAATIPHGLAEEVYSFTESPGDRYLAFLGRISPEKRPDRAISIAKRLGMRLKMAAKVDAVDAAYFRDEIKPLLDDPLIEFIGEIGDGEKSAFLGNAVALLFPDRLARAIWSGADRGHGLRNAGDRVVLRIRRRDRRGRENRIHRR